MTLSLCMIVKNEGAFLEACLVEARPYCFEMVVVDTGSTDQSKAVALGCGAKVFDFVWIDDFSQARNFACAQANGDWILMLDADERISPDDWRVLTDSLKHSTGDFFDLCQINYTNHSNVVGFAENQFQYAEFSHYKGYTTSWLTRLFKNNGTYIFKGAVHEHLTDGKKILSGQHLPVNLHHHGQALAPERLIEKKQHYLRIGEKKAREHPTDFKAQHEAGIACWELGQLEHATQYLKRSDELHPRHVINLIALATVCQIQKKYPEAEQYLVRARTQEPQHSSVHAALGRVYFERGQYAKATAAYKEQIRINPDITETRTWLDECYTVWRQKEPDRNPTLTVCYITKNEADCLDRTLTNVKAHAAEVIVVDTGSTDNTIEIAKRHGAVVHTVTWRDDFAWARNQSLKHATAEWILVLDADEVLSEQDWEGIKTLIRQPQAVAYYLVQTTYANESTIFGWKLNTLAVPEARGYRGYFESPLVRLFKNTGRIRFRGAVHEHAHHDDPQVKPMMTGVRIHHYGKWRDEQRMQEKSELYHRIGQRKLQEMPGEAHVFFEMAIQLWEMGDLDVVESYLVQALTIDPRHQMAGTAYACFLHQRGRLADAIDQFVKVIKNFPSDAEAHFFLSSVLIEAGKYDMAQKMITKAREFGFANEVTLKMNEGVIALNQNDLEGAEQCYLAAYALNPQYGPLLINLAVVRQKRGDLDGAKSYLDQAQAIDPHDFQAHKYLGEVLFTRNEKAAALREFLLAHDLSPKNGAVITQVIICAHALKNQGIVMEFEARLFKNREGSDFPEMLARVTQFYQQRGDQVGLERIRGLVGVVA